MNDVQINRLNSLIKSDDFLDDNAVDVAVITQIPPLATNLKNKIVEITDAAAKGDQDLKGVREDKTNKRKALEAKMLQVARGAAAYYQSDNKLKELRIVDYKTSDLRNMRDAILYAAAKELHAMATADVASLINVVQADLDQLDTDKEAFFEVIQDPKREEEVSKVQNARITPLLNEGADIRKQIDIYMQTLIATNETLYNEWAESLAIDDTGSSNPPIFTVNVVVLPAGTQAVDYSAITLEGNYEVKLINDNASGELDYGFGSDDQSFASFETVNPNAQNRQTATSLGYDQVDANSLNVRNNTGVSLACDIEIYEM